jgi:hypothetical protein
MTMSLEEFHEDFFNQVRAIADAEGQFLETSFLEHFAGYLEDSGEFDTFDLAQYRAAKGMRVDGYAGDPLESNGVLTLVICDFRPDIQVESLTRTELDATFKRLENFLKAALTDSFRDQLEESSEGYGLADLISVRRGSISGVRLIVLSNRSLSKTVEGVEAGTISGLPVTYDVWDISRLHRLVMSGKGKEDIEIDLVSQFGKALPCLPAHIISSDYQAFLVVIPAKLLAEIYDRWGARLLEQNVRCFLQARGNVNKGIRNTILNDPEMFFAYNNGVTATAELVATETIDGTTQITKLRNLQIVNGGQTTASIFSARKKDKADLEKIFVQMKLSVVDPARSIEVVPRISEYANSQNRVNAADFFANHPFHVRMEEYSRRIWAPSADGSFKQTKWFYERARGQYLDAKGLLKGAAKKKFEDEYPKAQCFTKTDLAKFECVWDDIPQIVSKGAQHNFAEFAKRIGVRWAKDKDQFNELYFRSAIARAIIFRETEKLISRQPWYDGGYRAQIVAYTVAKLADLVKAQNRSVDFEGIWKRQQLTPALISALECVGDAVRHVVTKPESGTANITEWAKKQACWARVKALEVKLPDSFTGELLDASEVREVKKDAKKVQQIDDGIGAQTRVIALGAAFWSAALDFAKANRLLSPTQRGILDTASKVPARIPSERQSAIAMQAMSELQQAGFSHALLSEAA